MKVSGFIALNILSLMVITEAQTKNEESLSSIDWSMSGLDSSSTLVTNDPDKSSDWSMSRLDSAPLLGEPVKSLELDNVNFNSDLDGSFVVPATGKGRREREVRAFFDLILNILESLRGPVKNDICRKDN